MDLKFFIMLGAIISLAAAAVRDKSSYFNFTAHALKVYGHSYYNPMTGEPLQGEMDDDKRLPFVSPKITFRGLPCACIDRSCGCCAGLNIAAIKFDRRYCANFTYDPALLTIDMKVMMNEDEVFETSLSARNPPPVCVPLPYVPVVDFCLRFYDLGLPGGNSLHTCIDFETRLTQSPLLVMHFNCVRVGSNGIAWHKPGNAMANATLSLAMEAAEMSIPTSKPPQQQQQTTDVYDVVNFEVEQESDGIALNVSTLSPEDEDKIGTHRHT